MTAMDHPLGTQIGNALEVDECVRLLQSPPHGRLAEVACELAAVALAATRGDVTDPAVRAAREELVERWARGEALRRLSRMIEAQGGDPGVCDDPAGVLPRAPVQREVHAGRGGYLAGFPARAIGDLAAGLGAGRTRRHDPVDPAVGLVLPVEPGAAVEADTTVATIHARTEADARDAAQTLERLTTVTDEPPAPLDTILERMTM